MSINLQISTRFSWNDLHSRDKEISLIIKGNKRGHRRCAWIWVTSNHHQIF